MSEYHTGKLQLGYDFAPIGRVNDAGRSIDMILKDLKIDDKRTIPAGFLTDWGSVPKLIDRVGIDRRRGSWAYLKHDFNYRLTARGRLISDVELYHDQWIEAVPRLERCLVFWGVRLGGREAYEKEHSPEDLYIRPSQWGDVLMKGLGND